MANDYFQFKQFNINQAACAMKVCTDSCLFGAYIHPQGAESILDIGTGTGLLALMMAQKADRAACIKAVELDAAAAKQARENVAASPWPLQVTVVESSIQDFAVSATQRFDLIISNPPFFSRQLKRNTKAQNLAMHSEALSLEELVECVCRLLADKGRFAVLLPPQEAEVLQAEASAKGLYLEHDLKVYAVERGRHLRSISIFSRNKDAIKTASEISIKDKEGNYTAAFVALLKDFYLHL